MNRHHAMTLRQPMTLKKRLIAQACAVGLAAALGSTAWAAGDVPPLQALRTLVDSGQYDKAYDLAQSQTTLQGSAHFDFLYGVAAVNSGHQAQGVLALERHLLQVPSNDRARLELARGYYDMGDYFRARQEFEFVLRFNPPKDVQANIQRYLDSMQTRDLEGARASSRSYLELGGGYDSNVNSGSDLQIFNDRFGAPSATTAEERALGRNYSQWLLGTQVVKRIDSSLSLFAGADVDAKLNDARPDYDLLTATPVLGFTHSRGLNVHRLTLSNAYSTLGGTKYRTVLSATGDGQYALGGGYMATAMAQIAELSYFNLKSADGMPDHDARMLTLGGGMQGTLSADWRPTFGVQLTVGHEGNVRGRKDFSREIWTAKLTVAASPSERLSFNLAHTFQNSFYEGADTASLDGKSRRDTVVTTDFGMNYLLMPQWMLRAAIQWSDNGSNLDYYRYRRTVGGMHLRYLF